MLAVKDTITTEPFNFKNDNLEMSSVINKFISNGLLLPYVTDLQMQLMISFRP